MAAEIVSPVNGPARLLRLLLLVQAAVLACCGARQEIAPGGPTVVTIEQEYASGPVRVILRLDKERLSVAETLTLNLETIAPTSVRVELPQPAGRLGPFHVLACGPGSERLTTREQLSTTWTCSLEPPLPGSHAIPQLEIGWADAGDPSASGAVRTDPVPVEVHSLLAGKAGEVELHPLCGPLDLPANPPLFWLLLAGTGALVLIGGAWVRHQTRQGRAATAEPAPDPGRLAWEQLAAIEGRDSTAVAQDSLVAPLFFEQVEQVLRRYLESRFAISSASLTKQQLLRAAGAALAASGAGQERTLQQALEICERARFAGRQARGENAVRALELARNFIAATSSSGDYRPETNAEFPLATNSDCPFGP